MGIISARCIKAPLTAGKCIQQSCFLQINSPNSFKLNLLLTLMYHFTFMMRAKISTNTYEIESTEAGWIVNGSLVTPDIYETRPGHFHIRLGNSGYNAEVVAVNKATKQVTLKIQGVQLEVALQSKMDLLLEKMGMHATLQTKANVVKAPMPGQIIELRVSAGDAVSEQDPLLILEAMKMENVIKSPTSGKIKSVHVKKGDNVEKNFVLIEFE